MRFKNRTVHSKIDHAIWDAHRLLQPESSMMKTLEAKQDFKFGSGAGRDVVIGLLFPLVPLQVFTYRPINPFTSAIGYFDGEATHINSRKLPAMEHKDIVANLLHEYSHYAGFKHGNNYKTQEKVLYSVPYYISENINRWL